MSKTRRDVVLNLIGNVVPLGAAFLLIPFLSGRLGAERFGFLTLLWALIGYAGLFDLGIGRALTYHASLATAPVDPRPLAPSVRAGMQVVGVTALVGALVTAVFSGVLARLLLRDAVHVVGEARGALLVTSVAVIPTAMGNGLRGVLEGLQEFRVVAWVKAVTGAAFFAVPAALVGLGAGSLVWIAVAFLCVRLAAFVWCWAMVVRDGRYSATRHLATTGDVRKQLLSYGAWVMVSAIISPLMVYGDRFIISSVMGAGKVGLYSVLQEILGRSLVLAASFAAAVMPRLAVLDRGDLGRAYARYFTRLLVVMAVVYAAVAVAAPPLSALWLSRDLSGDRPLFLVFSVALYLNSVAQLPYTLLHARGNTSATARFHLLEFALYVPACALATRAFGLLGAAGVWLGRVALDLALLHWAARREADAAASSVAGPAAARTGS